MLSVKDPNSDILKRQSKWVMYGNVQCQKTHLWDILIETEIAIYNLQENEPFLFQQNGKSF